MLRLSDIKWAAEECERQQSGELSVYNLCVALHYIRETRPVLIDLVDIRILGQLVEPEKNKNGFRQVPVYFNYRQVPGHSAGFDKALPHQMIESALTSLITHGTSLTPADWYKEFESIHPFIDGNGRVGAILFNLKNGTLKLPIAPPKVF